MTTQKVAITIPMDILSKIDTISRKLGLSRSKYISMLLNEKLSEVIEIQLKESYDRVFSDDAVKQEQVEPTEWSSEP
jgi:metal-responsive CopG/Arc/MetJ family transcriptional regulator